MALDKQKVNIAFAQGVDTKSDPKQVIPGKLLALENGVFQKTNSIIKRNGYDALYTGTGTASNVEGAIGLSTFKDQLFMLATEDGLNLNAGYTYAPSQFKWSDRVGYYAPVNVERAACGVLSGTTSPYAAIDHYVDFDEGLEISVYLKISYLSGTTTERLYYNVRDIVTDSFLVKERPIPYISSPKPYIRVIKTLGEYWVFFQSKNIAGTADALYFTHIAIGSISGSFSTLTQVAAVGTTSTTYADSTPFDVIYQNNRVYVSYANGVAGTFDLTIKIFDLNYTNVTTVIASGFRADKGSAMCADASNNIYVATNDGTNIKALSYTSGLGTLRAAGPVNTAGTAISNVVVSLDPTTDNTFWIFFTVNYVTNEYTAPNSLKSISATLSSGAFSGNENTIMVNAAVYAKPFIQNNLIKVPTVSFDGYGTYTYYIIDGTYSYAEAKLLTQSANPLRGNPIQTFTSDNNEHYLMAVERNDDIGAYSAWSYKVTYDHKPIFAEIANNLHITGGFINMFDGSQLAEHGFLANPSIMTTSAVSVGTGTVPAGDYFYKYTYEWVDAYGQLHVSAPSLPSTKLTLSSASNINCEIPCLSMTNKSDAIYIAVYRSSDGINYYKNRFTGYNTTFVNQRFFGKISFIDTYTFAQAYQGQPQLYTDGGEVDNIDPGAVTYLATYNQRLIAIPQELSSSWWYSKEVTPQATGTAGTPIYFSDEFVSIVDERSGGINGVMQLDEKLVFFKRSNIFATAGNGPAPNGSGNDFNPPQVVATDTGCTEGQSIVLGPSGIMFKSAKGIYLIDRSLSVSYIGAPVEAYNTDEVLSADLIFNLNQFRFGLSSGVALVYNYLFDQWSVFTNHAIVQACIYQNKYTFAKSDAVCWQESIGYLDDTTPISLKLTTSWLSFGDLQGFQRVYKLMLLGKWKTPHFLTVQVCHDFDDTVFQSTNINVLTTDPYEYRLFLTRQKCTAVKFTIFDAITSPAILSAGYEISAMAFEVGVKRGLNKLAADRSAG